MLYIVILAILAYLIYSNCACESFNQTGKTNRIACQTNKSKELFNNSYDILTKQFANRQIPSCTRKKDILGRSIQNWKKELQTTLQLMSTHKCIFNREGLPMKITTVENGSLMPLGQAVVDILNEKSNRTSLLKDIKNVQVSTTENQRKYIFNLFILYPNGDRLTETNILTSLVQRRILQDDIFAIKKYDTSKFIITNMTLLEYTEPPIKIMPNFNGQYYNFNMGEGGITSNEYIEDVMIQNIKKHDAEVDFRNINLEDDNYLNNYMHPETNCRTYPL